MALWKVYLWVNAGESMICFKLRSLMGVVGLFILSSLNDAATSVPNLVGVLSEALIYINSEGVTIDMGVASSLVRS